MHRETTIAREIELLKSKFEILEKNKQFKSILQKSGNSFNLIGCDTDIHTDINLGLQSSGFQTNNATATSANAGDSLQLSRDDGNLQGRNDSNQIQEKQKNQSGKKIRMKLSKFKQIAEFVTSLFKPSISDKLSRKKNRVSAL